MREDELARERKRRGRDARSVTKGVRRPVSYIDPDPDWHPIAMMVWEGALSSGQADFYQNSDVALLWMVCEEIDQYKRSRGATMVKRNRETGEVEFDENGEPITYWLAPRRNAQLLSTINTTLSNLLISEGDRRRARMELDVDPEEDDTAEVLRMERRRQQRNGLRGPGRGGRGGVDE